MSERTQDRIIEMAEHLQGAETTRKGVAPLTSLFNEINLDDAYHVQLFNIDKHLQQGEKITGKKIGLTSKAMQEMLGVDQPDYGHLLDGMAVEYGGTVDMDKVLQPRVEGEIAFVLKQDLVGPNVTVEDVLEATDYVLPAIEIIDSRIQDWKITLVDTVADNASSGLYVVGNEPISIADFDLKKVEMALFKNGELVNTGLGRAALGDPAYCVAWLANKLFDYGIHLKKGEVILSGALAAAVSVTEGDLITVHFTELGNVCVSFGNK